MFQVNEYFDGKVKSIAFNPQGGNRATVGVMAAGEYTFNTSTVELMTVTTGQMDVKLKGDVKFNTYHAGETFRVDAGEAFDVRVTADTAYLCIYK